MPTPSAANETTTAHNGAAVRRVEAELRSQGIPARVERQDSTLILAFSATPERIERVDFERLIDRLAELPLNDIDEFAVSWQQPGNPEDSWQGVYPLQRPECNGAAWWQNILCSAGDTSKTVVQTAGAASGAIAEVLGRATVEVGKTATVVGEQMGQTLEFAGDRLSSAATEAGNTLGDVANTAGELFERTTRAAGDNPLLRRVVDRVDLDNARSELEKLQAKHPGALPEDIAHRLTVKKAVYASGSGFASSLLPGIFAGFVAVDMAAMAGLQAELVYQIAGAYGLDLEARERKGEVLAIFGAAFGGQRAIRAGLLGLRTVPAVGALVGASANAAALYTVGYAARRFYEGKRRDLSNEESLAAARQESDRYLDAAISREIVADMVLVRVMLAARPDTPWEDLKPQLETAQFSPASIEAIAQSYPNLPPLEELLARLDDDFARSVLARCQRVVEVDENAAPEAQRAIAALSERVGSADASDV